MSFFGLGCVLLRGLRGIVVALCSMLLLFLSIRDIFVSFCFGCGLMYPLFVLICFSCSFLCSWLLNKFCRLKKKTYNYGILNSFLMYV
jgi:hypothetical protein